MKRYALATAALAALGVAACQQSTTNEGATKLEVNGAAAEQGVKDIGNRAKELAKDGVNVAREGLNELRPVGNSLANGARAAWNETKEAIDGNSAAR